jgi:putative Holliday junction resolvase
MRVLALDLGAKRIGLAISDAEASIAFPLDTLANKGREPSLKALMDVIAQRDIERVVIGLPIHMDGRKGPEAEVAIAFANALAKRSGLEVDTLDERLTTVEAAHSLRETGRSAKRQKAIIDSVAACILLRTYLQLRGDELRSCSSHGTSQ